MRTKRLIAAAAGVLVAAAIAGGVAYATIPGDRTRLAPVPRRDRVSRVRQYDRRARKLIRLRTSGACVWPNKGGENGSPTTNPSRLPSRKGRT
jgi:hypothetical protein